MIDRYTAQRMLELAEDLRARVAAGEVVLHGLCGEIGVGPYREELFTTWPEFTGCLTFPVPAPKGTQLGRYETLQEAAYMRARDMYSGEYGAARMRLLDHIIETLRNRVWAP